MIITLTGANFSANNINSNITRHKITFTCKDSDGGTLSPASNIKYFSEGSSITFSSSNVPSISGYKFSSATPSSISNLSSDTTVTVTYTKSSSGESDGSVDENVSYLYNYYISDDNGYFKKATSEPYLNCRAATETLLKINKGDSITTSNNNIPFIGYVWQDENMTNYLGYAKLNNLSSGNWVTSCTFEDTLTINNVSTTVTYPIYVRLVFKSLSGASFTIEDFSPKMTYNVSDYIQVLSETTVNNITFKAQSKIADDTGEILFDNDNARAVTETFIKVNSGDIVTLTNSDYKMLIYGYSTPSTSSFLGYIDTNVDDDSSSLKNWGNNFTFTSNLAIEGVSTPVSYPIYIRVTFRTSDGKNNIVNISNISSSFNYTGTSEATEV